MSPDKFSVFEYLYRDASNYKAWGLLLLVGIPTDKQITHMLSRFESGEFFIAEQIGVPELYQELWQYSNGPTTDDHNWHTFHTLRPATHHDIASNLIWGSFEKLLFNIQSVSSWTLS